MKLLLCGVDAVCCPGLHLVADHLESYGLDDAFWAVQDFRFVAFPFAVHGVDVDRAILGQGNVKVAVWGDVGGETVK